MTNEDCDLTDVYNVGSFDYYRNALSELLLSLSDCYEHFLFGTRTNNTESFHFLCNLYYTKGQTVSFDSYQKRKYFAGLDWNETKQGLSEKVPQLWQLDLMKRLLEAIKRKRTAAIPVKGKKSAKSRVVASPLARPQGKKRVSRAPK